jgi:hypothetical protein
MQSCARTGMTRKQSTSAVIDERMDHPRLSDRPARVRSYNLGLLQLPKRMTGALVPDWSRSLDR